VRLALYLIAVSGALWCLADAAWLSLKRSRRAKTASLVEPRTYHGGLDIQERLAPLIQERNDEEEHKILTRVVSPS
jgi:hypothetical protein